MIVKFDGKPIKESRDLPKLVAATPVGKEVEVVIIRGGKEQTEVDQARPPRGWREGRLARRRARTTPERRRPRAQKALGLELSTPLGRIAQPLPDQGQRSSPACIITGVDPRSDAADKRLQAGEILLEINQEPVADPADAVKKMKALKDGGKKSALLIVANGQGDTHFVALNID